MIARASVDTPKTCMDECMGQRMLACMNGKGMCLSRVYACVSRASALFAYYYCMCVACYYYM